MTVVEADAVHPLDEGQPLPLYVALGTARLWCIQKTLQKKGAKKCMKNIIRTVDCCIVLHNFLVLGGDDEVPLGYPGKLSQEFSIVVVVVVVVPVVVVVVF